MKTTSQIAEALKSFTPAVHKVNEKAPNAAKPLASKPEPERTPYGFNLGLDFGTAFTKCMLRDLRQDRAWPLDFEIGEERVFLLPSEVYLKDGMLLTALNGASNGTGLGCLKMALYAAVNSRRGDPWLSAISRHWPNDTEEQIHEKIEALVIHFLAAVIRRARRAIVGQQPDFGTHPRDTFTVNMAVPIAHVGERGVEEAFQQCLNRAWRIAQDFPDAPVSFEDALKMVAKLRHIRDDELCAVYPEVSANVQAYIRGRRGFEGLFMFVDVGAGTVDSSTFIYWPIAPDGIPLSYLSAEVVALGSSQVELRASAKLAEQALLEFRRCKEGLEHVAIIKADTAAELKNIYAALRAELLVALSRCAGNAFNKVDRHTKDRSRTKQWKTLKIILGGGGCALSFYAEAATNSFRTWDMKPDAALLPPPIDVEWPEGVDDSAGLFKRMTVAYGLSFDFPELDRHRLPEEIAPIPVEEEANQEQYHAPTKDEV